MTKSIEISQEPSKQFELEHSPQRWSLYYVVGIIANDLLWGTTLLVLKFASTFYSSKFYVSLPSSSSSTNVILANLGATFYEFTTGLMLLWRRQQSQRIWISELESITLDFLRVTLQLVFWVAKAATLYLTLRLFLVLNIAPTLEGKKNTAELLTSKLESESIFVKLHNLTFVF